MNTYLACCPDYDDTYWFEVDGYDREDAAEEAAEFLCGKDSEFYECFEHGYPILIKNTEDDQCVYLFQVYMEMSPIFRAVPE